MENGIEVGKVLQYGLTTLGLFLLIYLLAVLTPWMAKHVDAWIARYRENHDPRKDETYGLRSIYELPPKKEPPPGGADSTENCESSTENQDKG